MKAADELGDVLFLDRHPSWTYGDLMATPEYVIETMRMIDLRRATLR